MRSHLSAVRHLHVSKGYEDPLANTPRLDLALKGAKRLRLGSPDTHLPITPLILRRIKSTLLQDPYNYDNILLWAACCLGFFCLSPVRGDCSPRHRPVQPSIAPHASGPGICRTIDVTDPFEGFQNRPTASRYTPVCGCDRQRSLPNCSHGDLPSSEGHGTGPIVLLAVWTTTVEGTLCRQGQVGNEGSGDGSLRVFRSLL